MHRLIKQLGTAKLPQGTTQQVLLDAIENIDTSTIDYLIGRMKSDGLVFAWVQLDETQPPYALIDLQRKRKQIILPPFLYVANLDLVALITTNGTYIHLPRDQVWSSGHRIEVKPDGYPYYDSMPLVDKEMLDEALADDTMH